MADNQNNDIFSDGFHEYEDKTGAANADPIREETVTMIVKQKTHAFAIVSLITGIVSLICCCTGYFGIPFAVLSIVFAIVSRRHLGYFDSMTVVGLVLGIIGLIIGVFFVLVWSTAFSDETLWEEIQRIFEEAEGEMDTTTGF